MNDLDFINNYFSNINYYNKLGVVYLILEEKNISLKIKNILLKYDIICVIKKYTNKYILVVKKDYTYKLEMELLEEKWKQSEKFPNYEASTRGRVRNIKTKYVLKRTLKYLNSQQFILYDKKTHNVSAHTFICNTYFVNIENKPTVDHINKNHLDTRPSNLRFATHKEQANNRKTPVRCGKKIDQLDLNGNFIKSYDKIIDATKELKITHIVDCIKGKRNNAGGYKWRYSDITIENEIWKKLPENISNNHYISNMGRIRKGNDNSTITYGYKKEDNYYYITINNIIYRISRLQHLTSGLLDPSSKNVVDHLDENRSNNNIDNLEVITVLENCNRSIKNRKEKNGGVISNINSNSVLCLDKKNNIIKEYICAQQVILDGFDSSCVIKCCKGKRLTHKNYYWKYKKDY